MICVEVLEDGSIVYQTPQPVEVSGCSFVLLSSGDAVSPLHLTTEQGAQISVAIIGVWAVAMVVRILIRSLNVDDNQGEST